MAKIVENVGGGGVESEGVTCFEVANAYLKSVDLKDVSVT